METEQSIQELKEQLNEIGREKEKYYNEKEALKKQILSIISDIRNIKSDSDKSNVSIKEVKEKRDSHNRIVKDLIAKIREINEKRRELIKKHDIREDPSKIKEEMDYLELKVETEALTLSQ